MPLGHMPVEEGEDCRPENYTKTQWRASLNVWPPPRRRQTGQNTDKGHTPRPRIEMTISGSAENRTQAAWEDGRVSTDHATATDL